MYRITKIISPKKAGISGVVAASHDSRPARFSFAGILTRFPSPLLLFLIPVLFSCGSIQSPEFKNVDNIRVERLGKKESSLLAELRYYNPNNTRLQLKSAIGDAWIDGEYLGKFSVDSLVQVPARGDFSLPVTLKTDLGKLLQHSFSALLGREINIKLKGKARVGKGFIFINYPIEYEGKTRLDQLKFDN